MEKENLKKYIQENCWCDDVKCYMIPSGQHPFTFYLPVKKDELDSYLSTKVIDSLSFN